MEDLEAWQLIVTATRVNDLMAALQHIGLKAGVLVPDPAVNPVAGSEHPVDEPPSAGTAGSNGDGHHEEVPATSD